MGVKYRQYQAAVAAVRREIARMESKEMELTRRVQETGKPRAQRELDAHRSKLRQTRARLKELTDDPPLRSS